MRTALAIALISLLFAACQESADPTEPSVPNLAVIPGAPGGYRIQELELPGAASRADYWSITATSVNNRGQIVGEAYYQGVGPLFYETSDALLWQRGHVTVIGRLPGRCCGVAVAISDRGEVAGHSLTFSFGGAHHDGWVWDHGTMTDLDPFGGNGSVLSESRAYDVNNRGEVIGRGIDYINDVHYAYLWTKGTFTRLDLDTPKDIDDEGDIVGSDGTGDVLLRHGARIPLTAPDGSPLGAIDMNNSGQVLVGGPGGCSIWKDGALTPVGIGCAAMNDRGQVVGSIHTTTGALHAAIWSAGVTLDLGVLPGCSASGAKDVNNQGVVVGYCTLGDHEVAVSWTPLGGGPTYGAASP